MSSTPFNFNQGKETIQSVIPLRHSHSPFLSLLTGTDEYTHATTQIHMEHEKPGTIQPNHVTRTKRIIQSRRRIHPYHCNNWLPRATPHIPTNGFSLQIDACSSQVVPSFDRVMKSSYYDLLDKYFGEFCGDGDEVDVVDEDVGCNRVE